MMISSTLKTILIDGDFDDSSLLLDVHQTHRDKDLLTNHFDDVEDDSHDPVSIWIFLFLLARTFDTLSTKLSSNIIRKNNRLFFRRVSENRRPSHISVSVVRCCVGRY